MKAIPQKARVAIKWIERSNFMSAEGIEISSGAQARVMPIIGTVEAIGDGNVAMNGVTMPKADLDAGDMVIFAPNLGVRFDDEKTIIMGSEYVYAKLYPKPLAQN